MTERDIGRNFSWWVGEVVNTKDAPDQDGRVRVRIFGRHDDKTNIPDDALPWAMPLQPITSAAIGGVGTAPLGLLNGSKVYGSYTDVDQQYPIIFGSFGKAGDLKGDNTTAGGTETIDVKTGSMPPAARGDDFMAGKELNAYTSRYKGRKTITDTQKGDSIANTDVSSTGVEVRKDVDKDLKEPESPTTASNDKEDTSDILDVIKKVDPSFISSSLPKAVASLMGVRNIIALTSPTGLTNMLSNALNDVMGSLAGQLGLSSMLPNMMQAMNSGLLSDIAKSALRKAIGNIIKNGIPEVSAVSTFIPQIDPLRALPPVIVDVVAERFVQQYFTPENDPYPGYIQWVDPTTNEIVYSLRGNEPLYASAIDHIVGKNSAAIQSTLLPVFKNAPDALKPIVIGLVINSALDNIKTQGISSILGNGISLNNIMSLGSKLIPNVFGNLQSAIQGHLPNSVLNVGNMQNVLNKFAQSQALLNMQQKMLDESVDDNNGLGALSPEDQAALNNGDLTSAERAALAQTPGGQAALSNIDALNAKADASFAAAAATKAEAAQWLK